MLELELHLFADSVEDQEFYSIKKVNVTFERPPCNVTQEMLNEAIGTLDLETELSFTVTTGELIIESLEDYFALIKTINEENPFWVLACGSL